MQNLYFKSVFHQNRRLWRGLAILPGLIFLFPGFASQSVLARSICEASDPWGDFASYVDEKLDQSKLQRTRWGLDVRQVSDAGVELKSIYSKNAKELFLPASTAKLFTTAVLASQFGPQYQIETPYFAIGNPPQIQQLRVQGGGDPTILEPQLLRMGQQLKSQGVQSIDTLVGDARAFAAPMIVPTWEWGDLQTSDGVPISSLSFSQNSLPLRLSPTTVGKSLHVEWLDGEVQPALQMINLSQTVAPGEPEYISLERSLDGKILTIRGQLQVGAEPDISYVAIANPTAYFLSRLKSALESQGIHVGRLVVQNGDQPQRSRSTQVDVVDDEDQGEQEYKLGAIASAPLSELLKEVNQSSNNFYAESLLRHFAWVQQLDTERAAVTTLWQSLDRLQTQLESLGVNADAYRLKDASGLSRHNLVSPESLSTLLMAVMSWKSIHPAKFQLFQESLAVAGQAGTLQRRFQGSPVAGQLFAKTGTLSGVVTLSGFLNVPGQPTLVLSLMANHSDLPITTLRETIDEIVEALHQAQSCVQNSPD